MCYCQKPDADYLQFRYDNGVQRGQFLRSIIFIFTKLNLFALLKLYVFLRMMQLLHIANINCEEHLEIFFEIRVMPEKLHFAVSQASLIFQKKCSSCFKVSTPCTWSYKTKTMQNKIAKMKIADHKKLPTRTCTL